MKRAEDEPVDCFRVYAVGSRLHFVVVVWRSRRALIRNRVREGLPKTVCEAHTLAVDEWYESGRKTPKCGIINFHLRGLCMETICHESLHATCAILRRLRFRFDGMNEESMTEKMDTEEAVAFIQGRFAAELYFKLKQRRLV